MNRSVTRYLDESFLGGLASSAVGTVGQVAREKALRDKIKQQNQKPTIPNQQSATPNQELNEEKKWSPEQGKQMWKDSSDLKGVLAIAKEKNNNPFLIKMLQDAADRGESLEQWHQRLEKKKDNKTK